MPVLGVRRRIYCANRGRFGAHCLSPGSNPTFALARPLPPKPAIGAGGDVGPWCISPKPARFVAGGCCFSIVLFYWFFIAFLYCFSIGFCFLFLLINIVFFFSMTAITHWGGVYLIGFYIISGHTRI